MDAPIQTTTAADDAEAVASLRTGSSSAALIDAVYWARHFETLQPIEGIAVGTAADAGDVLLLSSVRLDELEAVTSPPDIRNSADEVLARVLTREYYGVESHLLSEGGPVPQSAGRVVAGPPAMQEHPALYVESLNRAWWLMTGLPLVRSVFVTTASARADPARLQSALRSTAQVLGDQAESVAGQLRKRHGGTEEKWLRLCRSIVVEVGPEEKKGLSALLGRASRMRMCPRIPDESLP